VANTRSRGDVLWRGLQSARNAARNAAHPVKKTFLGFAAVRDGNKVGVARFGDDFDELMKLVAEHGIVAQRGIETAQHHQFVGIENAGAVNRACGVFADSLEQLEVAQPFAP